MFKPILGVALLFFAIGHAYPCGHQETICAERIIGKLSKGILIPSCDIDDLLTEAAKSERGSSSGDKDTLRDFVESETDWLVSKSEDIFDEREIKNLEHFLESIHHKGEDNPAALAEALCVIRQLF